MNKSDRLNTIVELNAQQEKKALEMLGSVQKKQNERQTQLDNLEQYRKDYQKKFDDFCKNGAQVGQILEFKSFIEKLDKAIQEQERALQQTETELNRARQSWVNMHNRTQSLEKIRDNAISDEQHQQNKREQSEQDDRISGSRRDN